MDYLKNSQFAALVLGIVFTIIAVATTFLAIKNAKKMKSFAKAISLILIAPFIACTSWMYLILSFLGELRKNELLAFVVALLLSVFIMGMVVIVAKALYSKHGAALEEYDRLKEERKAAEEALAAQEKAARENEANQAREDENVLVVEETGSKLPATKRRARKQLLLNDSQKNNEDEDENTIIVEAEEAHDETTQDGQGDDDFDKFVEEFKRKVDDDKNGEE